MKATFIIKVIVDNNKVETNIGTAQGMEDMDISLTQNILKVMADVDKKIKQQLSRYFDDPDKQVEQAEVVDNDVEEPAKENAEEPEV